MPPDELVHHLPDAANMAELGSLIAVPVRQHLMEVHVPLDPPDAPLGDGIGHDLESPLPRPGDAEVDQTELLPARRPDPFGVLGPYPRVGVGPLGLEPQTER